MFGEFPVFDNGNYTFLADYLPWGGGDGMEHRNSTVIASADARSESARARPARHDVARVLSRVERRAHPAESLEPFDFEDANISGELWLAEGFTNYYGR